MRELKLQKIIFLQEIASDPVSTSDNLTRLDQPVDSIGLNSTTTQDSVPDLAPLFPTLWVDGCSEFLLFQLGSLGKAPYCANLSTCCHGCDAVSSAGHADIPRAKQIMMQTGHCPEKFVTGHHWIPYFDSSASKAILPKNFKNYPQHQQSMIMDQSRVSNSNDVRLEEEAPIPDTKFVQRETPMENISGSFRELGHFRRLFKMKQSPYAARKKR
ncbi:hypothetical protein EGW08_002011 [Elysia chlorotica]|uniref:Uncharacterized protein n=1 Tax=Elysia chlorotica TaxID=188477 RepID=A0A433U8W4_ELYCH|nr:hypothetical protein EGW08_002011 [Elysia chlorotica]